jgi:histone-lysine N-methyltransferase SETMAR
MCQNVLEKIEEDPDFLNSVVTCDETWLFQYDPETKRQSMQWRTTHSPRPKSTNVRIQDQGNPRRFLRYSRNYYDSVRTTRSNHESDVLHWAFDKVSRKNSKKETGVVEEWLDSPPGQCSTAQCTIGSTVSGKKQVPVLHHAPYSPDLAPCDFFLFLKLNICWREHIFDPLKTSREKRRTY